MPELQIRWEDGVCHTPGTAFYETYVKLCGGNEFGPDPGNPDQQDEWAMTHEFFHWFGHHFQVDQKGNGSGPLGYPAAGAFGEGFASMMPSLVTGHRWFIHKLGLISQVEDTDYSGNLKTDFDGGLKEPALPWNLYEPGGTDDTGSGGWSWRILWDFYDTDNGMVGPPEPVTEFAVEWDNPSFDCDGYAVGNATHCPREEMGDFDLVGDPEVFRDVIINYLGGELIAGNLPSDPESEFYYDDRGYPGLDLTDFLDGALCRSNWHTDVEVEALVIDVMSFTAYLPENAPASCP